ncbi:MAG: GNAT family N-acetyltransferase [archaeon]|jgi:RimJ/RimL family protein N-acetyltransferase|nr:GNAT family N-acetyltransferase [archaeon]
MKLETKRLILRPVTAKDAKDLAESLNNLNISKWIVPMPYPYKLKDAKYWINKQLKEHKEKERTDYTFVIELKPNKRLIGAVGIFGFDSKKVKGELGYWLDQNHWQKGIMSEAVEAVISFGFNKLKLKKILIPAFAGNPGSNAIAKKFGFTIEGKMRQHAHCKATGKIHDENIWGLLRSEWRKN